VLETWRAFDFLCVARWKKRVTDHMNEDFPRVNFLNFAQHYYMQLHILAVHLMLDIFLRTVGLKRRLPGDTSSLIEGMWHFCAVVLLG
jgi:hypothetical protein